MCFGVLKNILSPAAPAPPPPVTPPSFRSTGQRTADLELSRQRAQQRASLIAGASSRNNPTGGLGLPGPPATTTKNLLGQ